jgi:hypothetical protein
MNLSVNGKAPMTSAVTFPVGVNSRPAPELVAFDAAMDMTTTLQGQQMETIESKNLCKFMNSIL